MKKISAIIACYRDEPAIPIMHARLQRVFARLGVESEIIFVNDCSPDNSRPVLTDLAARDPSVVVINHSRNFGNQSAFTSGMKIATGDAVVCLDGDLQDPPELIADFHARWLEGYDVVYGERVKRGEPLVRRSLFKAFYRVLHAVSYVNIPVDAGDFALLDRKVVDALNALPENNRFVRGLRSWVGFRQIGVPHVRPDRMFGRSTFSLGRYLSFARKGILSFSYAPLDLIMWLALAIVGLSFLGACWQFYWRLAFPERVPQGFTTVIILILFLGGVQLLCLFVIGSYISHIYDEVKRRPAFIIESILNDPRKKRAERAGAEMESYVAAGVFDR
jgi:glycosyltransferase involved in cell wall biosynthesis